MANASISQIKVGNITYDIQDANIKKAITVTTTEDSNSDHTYGLKFTSFADSNLEIDDYIITIPRASTSLRNPVATFTGTNTTTTATGTGWQLTYFNTLVNQQGHPEIYDFSFSNGILTAKRNIKLEISGIMNWTDSIAGIRGFGIFPSGTVGTGTEYSSFQYFPNTVTNRKNVVFPPKIFSMAPNTKLAFGRNQQKDAVYVNGENFSWVTIRVL